MQLDMREEVKKHTSYIAYSMLLSRVQAASSLTFGSSVFSWLLGSLLLKDESLSRAV